jgi:hypothetical protein
MITSAAFLYSWRWSICGSMPSSHAASGLQPDLVESGRQDVGRHAARILAEALRPGEGGLAAPGEGAHRDAQFLHDRPGQVASDLGDQPDDAGVPARLVQRAEDGPELWAAARP